MHDEKFVDPRLQAKERLFQQLHTASFDVIMHINAIQSEVQHTAMDISPSNEHYLALVRSYEITLSMCDGLEAELFTLTEATSKVLSDSEYAFATQAQICAAAVNCLNHWRIIKQIPQDLIDVEEVSATIKQRFTEHLAMWDGYFAPPQTSH